MQSSKDNLISQRLEYGHQQALPTLRTNQVGDQSTGEITIVCEGGGAHVQEVLVYFLEGILSENGTSVIGLVMPQFRPEPKFEPELLQT
jgi:hypothetical protein